MTPKFCTFDCLYCQIGKTTAKETERRYFYDPDSIVEQVVQKVKEGGHIDHVTLSGSGEPTLNADLGRIIESLKKQLSLPIAVITNGSLLWQKDVRQDLSGADVVLPSLDAPNQEILNKINRPHSSLVLNQIVQGLIDFKKEYKGQMWLEIMLINDINNDRQLLESFSKIISNIEPDKVQLNTVARPPAEQTIRGLGKEALQLIAEHFGGNCEVIASFEKQSQFVGEDWLASLLATLKRRSLTLDDIVRTTGLPASEAKKGLKKLIAEKQICSAVFDRRRFYMINDQSRSPTEIKRAETE